MMMQLIKMVWVRLIRFGFRLLYNELAWTYDVVSWLVSFGEWSKWQRAALPYLNGRIILEVGHGPGHLLLTLAQDGKVVYGVDLSSYMGKLAKRRLAKAGELAHITQASVQALPFQDAYFESILSTFPTDFIVDPMTLAELYRVLRENGRFVIVPEGHLIGGGLSQTIMEFLFRITGQRSEPFAVDEDRFWPAEKLWQPIQERFEAVGFEVQIEQAKFAKSAATVIVALKKG